MRLASFAPFGVPFLVAATAIGCADKAEADRQRGQQLEKANDLEGAAAAYEAGAAKDPKSKAGIDSSKRAAEIRACLAFRNPPPLKPGQPSSPGRGATYDPCKDFPEDPKLAGRDDGAACKRLIELTARAFPDQHVDEKESMIGCRAHRAQLRAESEQVWACDGRCLMTARDLVSGIRCEEACKPRTQPASGDAVAAQGKPAGDILREHPAKRSPHIFQYFGENRRSP